MTALRAIPGVLLRHRAFAVAFAAGLAMRVITMLGFPPAIWFGGDSASYLHTGLALRPSTSRLSGYGVALAFLKVFHSFAVVTAAAHLEGLAIAVMIYALLRRYGLPGWGATLAALPVLLDAYQIQLEQEILATPTFAVLVMAGLTLALWWRDGRPTWATATAALALGMAAVTWPVGLPVLILFIGYLSIRKAGWRALVTGVVAGALPLGLYLGWFDANYGKAAFNFSDGVFLWSRTMTFADCAVIKPPADERPLCPRQPVSARPPASIFVWEAASPLRSLPWPRFSPQTNALARNFALRAIAAQPGGYARTVLDDFLLTFSWDRPSHASRLHSEKYQFSLATRDWAPAGSQPSRALPKEQRDYTGGAGAATRAVPPFSSWMIFYQRYVFLRGPLVAIALLLGLAGIVASWLRGGLRRLRDWGGPALFPWLAAMAMLLVPVATADFSVRYVVPAQPVACLAAALAFVSLRVARSRAPDRLRVAWASRVPLES